MTQLNSVQQETIRTRPQQTRLKLSVFQPRTVLACQVNNANAQKGDRTIIFDSVSAGSYLNVENGMTLLVGTTPGARDVGKIRIKSADSSQFIVSENSNIAWADELHLTVIRFWEVWPVYPRIINDPNNVENVIFYKDYGESYSNQNSILGTFVTAGPNRAADVVGTDAQIYYSSTGTYSLVGDTLAHEWFFEGGTPTGSLSAEPGYVSYPTPGHYVTRHTVSGTNGGVDTTYRHVSIYNDANPPIQLWEMGTLDGSRSEGGQRISITVRENITINENDVVVIYSDDWYGDTHQSFGGNYPNNEKIFFSGYILKGSVRYNYKESSVSFEIGSITDVMKQAQGFSVSVESKASPATWYEILDLDVRRALYHYLKWHTTVLSVSDFQFVGTDQKIQYFDADRTSMYDAIDNLMRGTLVGEVVADRQGKIWAEVSAMAYSNPTGSFPSHFDISKRDWKGSPVIDDNFSDEISYMELGAIAYSGTTTGTFSALMSAAPGNAPSFRGKAEIKKGLAIAGQTDLNQLAGNIFANRNSKHRKIEMDMGNSLRNFDIAPQEAAQVTVSPDDTVRGLDFSKLYIPQNITWEYDAKNGVLLSRITFENVVTGDTGESIIIPVSPSEGGIGSGFKVPGIKIPKLPSVTVPSGFASSTGTSCCDQLGNPQTLCYMDLRHTTAILSTQTGQDMRFDSARDPSGMYDVSNGRIDVIASGTYTVSLYAEWTYQESSINKNRPFISVTCYNSAGTEKLNDGVGEPNYPDFLRLHGGPIGGGQPQPSQVGTQDSYSTVQMNVQLNAGDYFRIGKWLPNASPAFWIVRWDLIKIEINCSYS